jgi:predicted peroxiredoxin
MIAFPTRCLALTAVAAGWVISSGCATTHQRSAADSDGAFVHIKSGPDETHRVMMGLRMAQIMAEDRDVLVYLDVDAIDLVLRDSPDLAMEPFGSSHAVIRDLIDRGVPVFACPGCLQAASKTPEDLMPGVRVAEKDAFFGFTEGRILTIDY